MNGAAIKEAEPSYWAFISYSHADIPFATWLHRALETYRLPRHLQDGEGRDLPRRLFPVFRDRQELEAANDLGDRLREAIAASRCLVVICSPRAAKSRWVDEEIRYFRTVRPDGVVLAAILSGEPHASDIPGREDEECLPRALRFATGPDGELTDTRVEPLAADFREGGDGKRLARLKLVAGIIGVKLDRIVRRDAQRRHRRLAILAAASVLGMIGTSLLAYTAVRARDEAQYQRAQADSLVEFMITDLKPRLEKVGRLDVLDSVGERALSYYEDQDQDELDIDALGRKARALHLVGEVANLRGQPEQARRSFIEAAKATGAALQDDPDNWQRVFDHSQSEFWVGYGFYEQADWPNAAVHLGRYRDLGRKLVALKPDDPTSKLEAASGELNLGVVNREIGRFGDALASFDEAERLYRLIQPQDRMTRMFIVQAISHAATTLAYAGDEVAAEKRRIRQILQIDAYDDGSDRQLDRYRAIGLDQLAGLRFALGRMNEGCASLQLADRRWRELIALDPDNKAWAQDRDFDRAQMALCKWRAGGKGEAAADLRAISGKIAHSEGNGTDEADEFYLVALAYAAGLGVAEPATLALYAKREYAGDFEKLASSAPARAAILIAIGDAEKPGGKARRKAWDRAGEVLAASGHRTVLERLQKDRVCRRTRGKQEFCSEDRAGVPASAFGGIFAE
ncbi:toll/interleukin-1 receptor domain-containing protein [Croceicoccus sediminis]|uniref:toll/interleukin-1 receptor domain-containing protein n=1 Tax=Croceicoccus sediminis TaxID=2571150 RepID=UPI001182A285|nr:toll/interleukin-1 receptor domain-containing protein [Croceicoccus sediminis]